jgi:hypothetical protein
MKTIKMCARQDVSVIRCWIYMPELFAFHMFHFVLFCSWNWLCGTAKLGPSSSILYPIFIVWLPVHSSNIPPHYKIGITLFFSWKCRRAVLFVLRKMGQEPGYNSHHTPKLYQITFAPVKQLWMTTDRYH